MKKSHTSKTVKYLYKNGIRLICIDFDGTFISIHTKGKWDKSAIKLTDYIRPVFINLIRTAVKKGISIAIVSFSPQEEIIRECLNHYFQEYMDSIYIVTSNQKRNPKETFCKVNKDKLILKRKVPMILSLCNEIYKKTNKMILPKNTLLIDDDPMNIKIANLSGFKTYLFNKYSEKKMLSDLLKKQDDPNTKPTTYTWVYADTCKIILIMAVIVFLFWKDKNTTTMSSRLVTVKLQ